MCRWHRIGSDLIAIERFCAPSVRPPKYPMPLRHDRGMCTLVLANPSKFTVCGRGATLKATAWKPQPPCLNHGSVYAQPQGTLGPGKQNEPGCHLRTDARFGDHQPVLSPGRRVLCAHNDILPGAFCPTMSLPRLAGCPGAAPSSTQAPFNPYKQTLSSMRHLLANSCIHAVRSRLSNSLVRWTVLGQRNVQHSPIRWCAH